MKIKNTTQYFTLIELLVVITILAILMSLLQPALLRAIYKARTVACVSKLKDIGTGVMMYCDDNEDIYPTDTECYHFDCNRCGNNGMRGFQAAHSLSAASFNVYKGANAVHYDLKTPMNPYFGGDLTTALQCPHILNQREWRGYDDNSYQLYFRTKESYYITSPMLKLGDRWQNFSHNSLGTYKGMWFNIIAADLVQAGKIRGPTYHTPPRANPYSDWPVWHNTHVPYGSQAVPDKWEGRFWNKGMDGTSTEYKTVSYRLSNQYAQGNFLHDDGSVLSADLSPQDPETARMWGSRYIPGNNATDGP
jgi:prepilin-type N-terminal cleavage/methylation domain-containing protein